jgi:hypothetical protein
MVYNIQNYWIFGHCPSSGILETRKHNVSENGSVSALRYGWGTPTLLGLSGKTKDDGPSNSEYCYKMFYTYRSVYEHTQSLTLHLHCTLIHRLMKERCTEGKSICISGKLITHQTFHV